MKKLAFLFCFLFVGYAQAANHYGCTGLTGGGSGALDALDITGASTPNADNLADGDSALVTTISGTTVLAYWYIFDADGTTAESSPTVIRPDDYATAGVWRLAVFNANAIPDISSSYQPLEATLTDIADGTIAENLVNTANPWDVNEGGTGAGTFTDGGILLGSGTGPITALGVATNGQIPIGDGTTDPVLATITGTANEVTVTNGAGTITLSLPNDAGTDISADLEEEAHATEHNEGGTDEISNLDTACTVGTAYIYRAGGTDVADADVADDITASNYLPLAGGTLTNELILDENGVEFQETDTLTDCSTFAATGGGIFYDDSEGKFKKCQDNVLTDLDTSGGATALDDVGDPDANNSISMAGYTDTRVSTTDGWGGLIVHTNVANNASPTTLLTLQSDDADDPTNTVYLSIKEDMDGTPSTLFEFKGRTLTLGSTASIEGLAVLTASTSIGTAAAEVPNYYGADSHVFSLGNDQDVLITHVADTGINLTTTAATSGVFNLGNDDDSNDDSIDLILHDSGVITLYDADDDTSVTISVANGTTELGVSGSIAATSGVDLGTSQALVGTTAMTIGNNGQTVAVNSSDWDISATGDMTGIGAIGIDGAVTFSGSGSIAVPTTTSGDQTRTVGQLGLKTDEDLIVTHGGANGEVQDEVGLSLLQHISFPFDPSGWYDQESTYRSVPIMRVGDDFPHGFTVTEWRVTYVGGDPTTELDADLICDTTPDFNTAAGATVMDVLDTTAGAASADTGFDSATCANGSELYIHFGADPTDANVVIQFDLWGYAEED